MQTKQTEENFKVSKLTEWGFSAGKDYTLGKIDVKMQNIWLEAKRADDDIYKMLTQIIFTAKIEKIQNSNEPMPPYLGCFNKDYGAIIHEDDVYKILKHQSINWTQTPSKIDGETVKIVEAELQTVQIFRTLKEFGKKLQEIGKTKYVRSSDITGTNFVAIYHEWLAEIGRHIECNESLKPDCFLADVMHDGRRTITDRLAILRKTVDDDFVYTPRDRTLLFQNFNDIIIKDKQSYNNFWNKYKRPPEEKWQEIILSRKDLLKSDDERKKDGAFYTPAIYSKISKEYLATIFGENWQKEYYIWDCCCGTGNLEVGMINQGRIFMSTLDITDIGAIQQVNFMPDVAALFQFDFLNDEWKPKSEGGKIPNKLWEIIKKEPQKLIVYINPPYKESASKETTVGTGKNYKGLTDTKIKEQMQKSLATVSNDLANQFYFRIYKEIKGCKIGAFSKIKNFSPNCEKWREYFKAQFLGGFVTMSTTFENTKKTPWPLSFQVWDTSINNSFPQVAQFDIFTKSGERDGVLPVVAINQNETINSWFKTTKPNGNVLGYVRHVPSDFQNQRGVYLSTNKTTRPVALTKENLIDGLVYLAVRWAIPRTWLNDREQLLHPAKINKKDKQFALKIQESKKTDVEYEYEVDEFFIGNCIVFSLLHGQNHTNWQLFKNSEIGLSAVDRDLTIWDLLMNDRKLSEFSSNVLFAAKEIYSLYYKNFQNPNAGRNDIWQTLKSDDEFKKLNKKFIECQKVLASKIAEGMIEFGFIKI